LTARAAAIALVVTLITGCAAPATTAPAPVSSGAASPGAASPSVGIPAADLGRAFVDALAGGEFAAAEAMEDDTMRSAAPAAALAQLWAGIVAQFGGFRGILDVTTAAVPPYENATVTAAFADATVPLIVTVDREGRIAGFHLGEAGPPAPADGSPSESVGPPASAGASAAADADYVDPSAFTESEIRVGAAPWELPGTLSMPEGEGPFPAVVLLAGSGPQDRDETIGPNAPLRDLAHGLASAGIAVLRYDKRTLVHGPAMAADPGHLTVREETVDDAVAAVDLLRATPGVDTDRVFVVGHSLGGFLAPRVAAQAGEGVAGIGLLAANTSSLEDLILAQVEYLASEGGGADPQAAAALPALREQVARVKAPQLAPDTPASSLPLGIPPAYWLDLRTYDPGATAASLEIPTLVVQGGRDYQVPPSVLEGWRAALGGRDDVTIREYPALNHLLMEGSGPSRPAEYAVPGHVAPEVVEELVAWVRGR
jgi:dienelactone hydrolase